MIRLPMICTVALAAIALPCLAQTPPRPPSPPELPLVCPGAEVREQMDLRGDELREALRGEPELSGVRRVRIIRQAPPGGQGGPQELREMMRFLEDVLVEAGWQRLWDRSADRPGAVYTSQGQGFVTVMARPAQGSELVVTYVEGNVELRHMPLLEGLIRRRVGGPGVPVPPVPPAARERLAQADALARQGKWEQAMPLYAAVVQIAPASAQAHFGLGMGQKQRGETDAAIQSFRTAIQLEPMHPGARVEYGRLLAFSKRDFDGAIYELRQAVALGRGGPMPHELLGRIYREQARLDEAVQQYEAAARIGPITPESLVDLGRIYERKGQREQAISAYRRALQARPGFEPAQTALERLR